MVVLTEKKGEYMKCSELQIGDYVLVKPSMMPIKIAAVHHKKVGYHAYTYKLNWVRIDLLEPIPFTEKMAKKNGFVLLEVEDGMSKCWRYADGVKYVDFEPQILTIKVWNGGDNSPIKEVDYYTEDNAIYLHEVQHALRLCKINKEIVV